MPWPGYSAGASWSRSHFPVGWDGQVGGFKCQRIKKEARLSQEDSVVSVVGAADHRGRTETGTEVVAEIATTTAVVVVVAEASSAE